MNGSFVDTLPVGRCWLYEPKWDGLCFLSLKDGTTVEPSICCKTFSARSKLRCLALKDGTTVELQSKTGEFLGRYFPELLDALQEIETRTFVLDGQVVVPVTEGLSFDHLIQRVQTTESSIQSLARNYPRKLVVFDLLVFSDWTLFSSQPLAERRRALEFFFAQYLSQNPIFQLSPATRHIDIARRWPQILGKEITASSRNGWT
jgi:ATP-dependent DNA ligase